MMTRQEIAAFRFFHRKRRKVSLWEALIERRPVVLHRDMSTIMFDLFAYPTARLMDRRNGG